MITALLIIAYFFVCMFLIIVVLLQTGKRADLAGAFGGGGSQTAFGARGAATILAKATTGAAIAFMVLALVLALRTGAGRSTSVLEQVPDTEAGAASEPVPPPAEAPDLDGSLPPAAPLDGSGDGGGAASTPPEGGGGGAVSTPPATTPEEPPADGDAH
jgi:preprotein translocase subunit SecG